MIKIGQKMDTGFNLEIVKEGEREKIPFRELLDRPAIVSVYMRNNTPGCDKQNRSLAEESDWFDRQGYNLIAISKDGCRSHQNYASKLGIGYILASDPDHAFAKATDSIVEKRMFGKTFNAPSRSAFVIDTDGTVTGIIEKVDTANHAAELKELVNRLQEEERVRQALSSSCWLIACRKRRGSDGMRSLVIVESPTKTKTIKKYLPKGYVVDSSMGHIRDLPSSAKEIPAKFKKEPWANLGINVDEDFEPLYVVPGDKKKIVKKLKELIRESDELILATDEDREGEAISWHLTEVLKPKIPVKRMAFREITKEAILRALENFIEIYMIMWHAQEKRRCIDRLAGYTISPLLWKKISPGLSAGRVQSVAVSFLVQRERERMKFRSGTYYDLKASLNKRGDDTAFPAVLTHLNSKRIAAGRDFDENTGKLKKPKSVVLLDQKAADELREQLHKAEWRVSGIEVKKQKRSPAPPFITSTLQQEAYRKFGMSARDTMSTAQKLYENGLITYMRTDSMNLSSQAISAARNEVEKQYGAEYLFEQIRNYTKSKSAQEAHEIG